MAWIMTWEERGRGGEDPLPPPTQRPINLSHPPSSVGHRPARQVSCLGEMGVAARRRRKNKWMGRRQRWEKRKGRGGRQLRKRPLKKEEEESVADRKE